MAQRHSGYDLKPYDEYNTPAWVTHTLIDDLIAHGRPEPKLVWEPASGKGQMADVLRQYLNVFTSDVRDVDCDMPKTDFLTCPLPHGCDAIITNPPYSKVLCEAFIRRAINLMREPKGLVAMLLKVDYDSAKTRADMFQKCEAFARKLVLRDRIVWFEGGLHGPSQNHCWLIWDWQNTSAPTISYGPNYD